MHFFVAKLSIFCHHRCIRKIINSLPLRRKIASQFSSSAYVRTKLVLVLTYNYDFINQELTRGKTKGVQASFMIYGQPFYR
jgi:hypothetical protein